MICPSTKKGISDEYEPKYCPFTTGRCGWCQYPAEVKYGRKNKVSIERRTKDEYKKLEDAVKNLQPMPIELGNPDPNMELICLHCGKMHKPYDHMYATGPDGSPNDYAYMSFCSDKCFKRYHTWRGTVRRFFEEVVRWCYHRPKFRIHGLIWRPPICINCGNKMEPMIHGHSWHCDWDGNCYMSCYRFPGEHWWQSKYDWFGDFDNFQEKLPEVDEKFEATVSVDKNVWPEILKALDVDIDSEPMTRNGKELRCLYCNKPVTPQTISGILPSKEKGEVLCICSDRTCTYNYVYEMQQNDKKIIPIGELEVSS